MPDTTTNSQAPQPAHTPGPWRVCKNAPSLIEADIGHADGLHRTIAQALDPIPHIGVAAVNANARLISAAPDLLKALKNARDLLRADGYAAGATMDEIDAAIAKATGAQA